MLNTLIINSRDQKINFLSSLGFSSKETLTSTQTNLLLTAFIHKSYASDFVPALSHNERLEFLGDSILGACVSDFLFTQHADRSEADMTLYKIALVREESLADIARDIALGEELFISKGEERQGGKDKDSILSDSLEALIGACYIVYGYRQVHSFVEKYIIKEYLDDLIVTNCKSYKSLIQEWSQAQGYSLPRYETTEIKQEKTLLFEANIFVDDLLAGHGVGTNKKKAQEAAAKTAFLSLQSPSSSSS